METLQTPGIPRSSTSPTRRLTTSILACTELSSNGPSPDHAGMFRILACFERAPFFVAGGPAGMHAIFHESRQRRAPRDAANISCSRSKHGRSDLSRSPPVFDVWLLSAYLSTFRRSHPRVVGEASDHQHCALIFGRMHGSVCPRWLKMGFR